MKKQIILIVTLLTSATYFAQVGIRTSNPQTALHVDGAKDNAATGIPTAAQQLNDAVVTSTGSFGLATISPSEKLDIASGNARIRDINTNIGVGGTDRVVVADATGILKTINFNAYGLFHSRLAASQSLAANTLTTLLFSTPLSTSPYYTYNTSTGALTFNQPGNYIVTLQSSFTDCAAGVQLVLGIRPIPDASYLGRGSHYTASATTGTIGELMSYTTLIVVPSAGYQVRLTAASNAASTVLATETGGTGSGNVTNVTIQKI